MQWDQADQQEHGNDVQQREDDVARREDDVAQREQDVQQREHDVQQNEQAAAIHQAAFAAQSFAQDIDQKVDSIDSSEKENYAVELLNPKGEFKGNRMNLAQETRKKTLQRLHQNKKEIDYVNLATTASFFTLATGTLASAFLMNGLSEERRRTLIGGAAVLYAVGLVSPLALSFIKTDTIKNLGEGAKNLKDLSETTNVLADKGEVIVDDLVNFLSAPPEDRQEIVTSLINTITETAAKEALKTSISKNVNDLVVATTQLMNIMTLSITAGLIGTVVRTLVYFFTDDSKFAEAVRRGVIGLVGLVWSATKTLAEASEWWAWVSYAELPDEAENKGLTIDLKTNEDPKEDDGGLAKEIKPQPKPPKPGARQRPTGFKPVYINRVGKAIR
jgi:hypothetical protein